MDPLIAALTELGPLGLFAGFLVWQFTRQQKQIQSMVEGFEARIEAMQGKSERAVDRVRDRYDQIIEQKDKAYERLSGKLESDVEYIRGIIEQERGTR